MGTPTVFNPKSKVTVTVLKPQKTLSVWNGPDGRGKPQSAKKRRINERRKKRLARRAKRKLGLNREKAECENRPRQTKRYVDHAIWIKEHTIYLQSPAWRAFRETIIAERCTCQKCGSCAFLHVHHKHYRTYHVERPQDVLLLCGRCHDELHAGQKAQTALNLENYSVEFLIPRYGI